MTFPWLGTSCLWRVRNPVYDRIRGRQNLGPELMRYFHPDVPEWMPWRVSLQLTVFDVPVTGGPPPGECIYCEHDCMVSYQDMKRPAGWSYEKYLRS